MSDISPMEELRKEHESALEAMRGLADRVRTLAPGRQAADDLGKQLSSLRQELLLHFRKEEEALFPDVREMVAEGAPKVDILSQFFSEEADDDLRAHYLLLRWTQELATLLAEVGRAGSLDSDSAGRVRGLVNATLDLLQRHADKEQKLVFPMIERLLDASQMAAVKERMRAIRPALS